MVMITNISKMMAYLEELLPWLTGVTDLATGSVRTGVDSWSGFWPTWLSGSEVSVESFKIFPSAGAVPAWRNSDGSILSDWDAFPVEDVSRTGVDSFEDFERAGKASCELSLCCLGNAIIGIVMLGSRLVVLPPPPPPPLLECDAWCVVAGSLLTEAILPSLTPPKPPDHRGRISLVNS